MEVLWGFKGGLKFDEKLKSDKNMSVMWSYGIQCNTSVEQT